MKKMLLYLFFVFPLCSNAETHTVTISNFQFSPSNLNVLVGDIIRWEWAGGFHNTASVTIPAGASSWATPVSTTGFSFEYTVTAAGTYNYQCDPHAGFMLGSFTASGVLPVTLSGFTVSNQGRKPYLTWITQAETNTSHFVVRRSYDGNIFTEIGQVPAAGHSAAVRNYSFLDADVRSNYRYVYYELLIKDIDGNFQLSPIKLFKNNESVKKLVTAVSPNPVTEAGHLIIIFNADEKSVLLANVTDLSGKQLLTVKLSALPGVNNGHIHLGDLAAGTYTIRFTLNGKTETHKIIKK
ncbi:MAG: T9SS type A sorting domain-containing protein [Rhizobacter sp.]|nr:T9SS type A sorting domain-containing protein [Ferruginibacter sp.]